MSDQIHRELAGTRYIAYGPSRWAPYGDNADVDIAADLATLRRLWDGLITYGAKGLLATIPAEAARQGFRRVILGVYDVRDEEDVAAALELVERFPELIKTVCLGNEGLAFHRYSIDELVAVMARFRARFPDLLVTTSEPIFAYGEPRLRDSVDFCFPIIHPWIHEIFKDDPTAAAMWTIQAAQRLSLLAEKPVLIKETGFPGDGDKYPDEHAVVFWECLLRELGAFTQGVHLAHFEAFDNAEKLHFGARQDWDCYWGMYDGERQPKPVVRVLERYLAEEEMPRVTVGARAGTTVVVTTHDRPRYLRPAIESALAQGDELRRLVIVDDGSRDRSVRDICLDYASRPKVRYVHLFAGGSSGSARNAGLLEVDTDYVCFLDDDDAFLPGKLARQRKLLTAYPDAAFCATGGAVMNESGERRARAGSPDFFPGAALASMLAFCRVIHSSVMLRTSRLREYGGYREHLKGEDWELWCRLLRGGERMVYLPAALTLYRRHDANISTESYLREAVENVLSRHLDLPSEKLVAPLIYDPRSGELLKASLRMVHGDYARALEDLAGLDIPAARLARFICLREEGQYVRAAEALGGWSPELRARLAAHESRFGAGGARRRPMVGSPALLFEQRLLAADALSATLDADYRPDLARYFHPSPKYINIESGEGLAVGSEELFFRRVSFTSC